MPEKRTICITTDCVCDLPTETLKENDIDVVYFYIETDTGRFRDVSEITAQNIFDYLKEGVRKLKQTLPRLMNSLRFSPKSSTPVTK